MGQIFVAFSEYLNFTPVTPGSDRPLVCGCMPAKNYDCSEDHLHSRKYLLRCQMM